MKTVIFNDNNSDMASHLRIPSTYSGTNSPGPKSRNKENVPQRPSAFARQNRSSIPSLVKSPEKQDFFTDSYLAGNASQTSLIPSPLPQTDNLPQRSRRAVRVHQRPKHSAAKSDRSSNAQSDFSPTPGKPLARRTSPVRSNCLNTPPRSREGSFAGGQSPADVFSSPPAALLQTYTRIDQEEDLAATEGEISDDDDDDDDEDINDVENLPPQGVFHPQPVITPTAERFANVLRPIHAYDNDHTAHSTQSEPLTGMSFVDQLSDVNIRNTLTPHFRQNAQDREALDRVWKSKRPVAFARAGKVLLEPHEVPLSVSSSPQLHRTRPAAFTKASRIKLASDQARPIHQRTHSDADLGKGHGSVAIDKHKDNWHNLDFTRNLPPRNPYHQHSPYFSKVHGFPDRDDSVTRPLDDQENNTNGDDIHNRRTRSESPSTHGDGFGSLFSHDQLHRNNDRNPSRSVSDIWAQQAVQQPAKHTDIGQHVSTSRRFSDTQTMSHPSPDISRKMTFDFTGQSFQVSDSPPVRTKSTLQNFQRDREIQGLAQRAVTTNRLSQLRVRESVEKLRHTASSPTSETVDQSVGHDSLNISDSAQATNLSKPYLAGKQSRSTSRRTPDISYSHELLQRLSRQSSSTPRSPDPQDQHIDGEVIWSDKGEKTEKPKVEKIYPDRPREAKVQDTPKVVGAWTDTILPDTVKTIRQPAIQPKHTQTPFVRAGGWVDTPAPPEQSNRLEPLVESTQEIPEGLTDGIVKDSASDRTLLAKNQEQNEPDRTEALNNEGIARKILEQAKEKNDIVRPSEDTQDSLALGNTTIQSLQHILEMDETELALASRLGDTGFEQGDTEIFDRFGNKVERSDTEVLGRIGAKVEKLHGNIQLAQKMLIGLEEKIIQPEQPNEEIVDSTISISASDSYFPMALLTISIPIPMLFRNRIRNQRLPRPTLLGWIIFTLFTWYMLEITLGEIYSHPETAYRYTWPEEQEPEFPFVLPTMLWRWSRFDFWCRAVGDFFQTMLRFIGFGDQSTYDAGPEVVKKIVATTAVRVAASTAGYGFDMMNDEIL